MLGHPHVRQEQQAPAERLVLAAVAAQRVRRRDGEVRAFPECGRAVLCCRIVPVEAGCGDGVDVAEVARAMKQRCGAQEPALSLGRQLPSQPRAKMKEVAHELLVLDSPHSKDPRDRCARQRRGDRRDYSLAFLALERYRGVAEVSLAHCSKLPVPELEQLCVLVFFKKVAKVYTLPSSTRLNLLPRDPSHFVRAQVALLHVVEIELVCVAGAHMLEHSKGALVMAAERVLAKTLEVCFELGAQRVVHRCPPSLALEQPFSD